VRGRQVDYNGQPAGYTADPQENINYISAHDNETLFDAIQWKAPLSATVADRVRMNTLGLSLVMLGQGVPFFHAGDDLLRSKSLDGNSYNSGDWFNRLDWTEQSDNWGVGLPPNGSDQWDAMAALLGNPALQPAPADIQAAATGFQELLAIRRSSRLFRLETLAEVQQHLAFYNSGPDQIPGLIVMALENTGPDRLDDPYDRLVVLFNAAPDAVTFADPAFADADFALHPVQQASADAALAGAAYDAAAGSFTVPGRSAVVFVAVAAEPAVTATATAATATTAPPSATPPAATASPAPSRTPAATTTLAATDTPAPTATPAPAANATGWAVGLGLLLVLLIGAGFAYTRRNRPKA
jgi:pullulanase/glycogen debranching enzyme